MIRFILFAILLAFILTLLARWGYIFLKNLEKLNEKKMQEFDTKLSKKFKIDEDDKNAGNKDKRN